MRGTSRCHTSDSVTRAKQRAAHVLRCFISRNISILLLRPSQSTFIVQSFPPPQKPVRRHYNDALMNLIAKVKKKIKSFEIFQKRLTEECAFEFICFPTLILDFAGCHQWGSIHNIMCWIIRWIDRVSDIFAILSSLLLYLTFYSVILIILWLLGKSKIAIFGIRVSQLDQYWASADRNWFPRCSICQRSKRADAQIILAWFVDVSFLI